MNKKAPGLLEEFRERDLTVADFEHDVDVKGWAEKYRVGEVNLGPIFWPPALADLTPPRLAGPPTGLTGTAINLIQPSVVICDTRFTPFASFDMADTPARKPAVAVAFQADSYGITNAGTYVFTFFIDSGASVKLRTTANPMPSGVTVSGLGDITGSGARTITVVFKNLPPSQRVALSLEQQSGRQWSWFRTKIGFPPLVFELANP
jgi:hypothetical protein